VPVNIKPIKNLFLLRLWISP